MTVKTLSELCGFSAAALPSPDREITGCYVGDLLSWVMGRANAGDAWITIMSNQNVIAVASLADTSCVIFAEGVKPSDELIALAEEKEVNLLLSDLPTYESALKLYSVLK